MTTTNRTGTQVKHLEKTAREIPEWMELAREVMSRWEQGQTFLLPAIAEGLKAAYDKGVSSQPPEPEEHHVVKRVRRAR